MKKKLWVRELSCGHDRQTNIAFICGNYNKPKIGDMSYCRECCEEVKIDEVREEKNINEIEDLEKIRKLIKDKQNAKRKK